MLSNWRKPDESGGFGENRRTTGFWRTAWFDAGSRNIPFLVNLFFYEKGAV
jgi:hypothetical protein